MSQTSASEWRPLPRLRTHEQVVAEIENRLNSGKLKAGDRLPPERQFAEALGVSRGAVREALRILESIGVVEAGTGSGPTSGSRIVKDSTAGMGMVLRLHLQLPKARLGNFYRVLYGPYLFLNVVDLGQHRMKCRRFT